jgi:hypothetical protein
MITHKICKICNILKSINNFYLRKLNKDGYRNYCKECCAKQHKGYNQKHKEEIKEQRKIYIQENKYDIDKQTKAYRQTHKEDKKEYDKIYRKENKENINTQKRIYQNKKLKSDPFYKLRHYISTSIYRSLISYGSNKNEESCSKYLYYKIKDLYEHIENQFEDWMNWDNWGVYRSQKWDNNDPSTWSWQIDHIIPQSDLPFQSMEDENFKICWALKNLRPLSAKQNFTDGITRVRHKAANKMVLDEKQKDEKVDSSK